MMTIAELYTQLNTSKLPVAYDHFPETDCPDPPFVVFRELGTNNFGADDKVCAKIKRMEIELVTIGKDENAEDALEGALGFTFWEMTESYAENEKVWSTFYAIEI